jgi:5-formyltetrahydrofolate cyclo-ligase
VAAEALEQASGLAVVLPEAGGSVAAFASTATEPPTAELLTTLAERGLRVLIPAPGPDLRELAWTEVGPGDLPPRAKSGGVRAGETLGGAEGPEALAACALILAPALAVDRAGTRLGQGGGWYDRALAFAGPDALILGVCFPSEVFPAGVLPRLDHDVPVLGALTGRGVELFGAPASSW